MAISAEPGLEEVHRIPSSMNYCESLSNRFDLGESTQLRSLSVGPPQAIAETGQHKVLSRELQSLNKSGVELSESQAGDDSVKSNQKRGWVGEASSNHIVSHSFEIFSS